MTSTIVVIGEAPGETEEKLGRPFVGGSGQIQDQLMARVGLDRKDIRFENVLLCRPPGNKINTNDAKKAIQCCTPRLLTNLEALSRKQVIVPVGGTALHALGIDASITDARGFIWSSNYGKVVPTWHPAYVMRQWQEYDTSIRDWKKIRKHSYGIPMPHYQENFNLFPSILEVEEFKARVDSLTEHKTIDLAIDIETYYDGYMRTPLKLISFSLSETECITVPFILESGNWAWKSHDDELRAIMAVGGILENTQVVKMFHYGIFDISVLMNHGFDVVGPIFDSLLSHYLIYQPAKHDLKFVVSCYADYLPWKDEKGIGDDLCYRKYNSRDCIVMHLIKPGLMAEAHAFGLDDLVKTFNEAEIPTARMAVNGIHFDTARRDEVAGEISKHISELEHEIQGHSGMYEINLRSTKQVAEMLFVKLGLKSGVKTDGGDALSTNEEVLKKLCIRYPTSPVPFLLLDFRRAEKLRSTYIDPPVQEDGRVHSTFSLHGTITARFSSSEPNLQNLPSMSKDKTLFIRKLYSAEKGNVIIESDYSQVELRIFALLAGDQAWLQAFEEGADIHALNAVDVIGEYLEEYRRFIKEFIYGVIYGSEGSEIQKVAPLALLQRPGFNVKQCLLNLWEKHPSLLAFKINTEKGIVDKRRIVNPFGLIRWFKSKPTKENVREAMDFPMQSTVACAMHKKFAILDKELNRETDKIILQLHDSWYIETIERRQEQVTQIIKEIMESPTPSSSGLVFQWPIEQKIGLNMGEMKKVGL